MQTDVHSASTQSESRASANLVAGKWYAIGFTGETREIDWGSAMIYRYDGDGCWSDDEGEVVHAFWDPFLQMLVSTDAACAYEPQS